MGGEWGPEQRKTATAHFQGTGCGQLCGARTAGAGREQGRGETATPLPLTHVNSKHQFWGRGDVQAHRTCGLYSMSAKYKRRSTHLPLSGGGGAGWGGAGLAPAGFRPSFSDLFPSNQSCPAIHTPTDAEFG